MGEYADEMIDRILDWDPPGAYRGKRMLDQPGISVRERPAEWHAEQNRLAAEDALDQALADEEEN